MSASAWEGEVWPWDQEGLDLPTEEDDEEALLLDDDEEEDPEADLTEDGFVDKDVDDASASEPEFFEGYSEEVVARVDVVFRAQRAQIRMTTDVVELKEMRASYVDDIATGALFGIAALRGNDLVDAIDERVAELRAERDRQERQAVDRENARLRAEIASRDRRDREAVKRRDDALRSPRETKEPERRARIAAEQHQAQEQPARKAEAEERARVARLAKAMAHPDAAPKRAPKGRGASPPKPVTVPARLQEAPKPPPPAAVVEPQRTRRDQRSAVAAPPRRGPRKPEHARVGDCESSGSAPRPAAPADRGGPRRGEETRRLPTDAPLVEAPVAALVPAPTGADLLNYRRTHGLSQRQAAEVLGVAHGTVAKSELLRTQALGGKLLQAFHHAVSK